MFDPWILAAVFVALWLVTWYPCWRLLLILLAMVASPGGMGLRFWALFTFYRILIALPYVVLLWLGMGVIGDILKSFIIGFVIFGVILSLIRFMASDKIIATLWYVYGYVYDGLLNFYPYRKLIDQVIGLSTKQSIESPNSILEIGCGTGNVIVALADRYPSADITGIDISSSMLKIARRKTKANLQRIDAQRYLSQTNEKYDLIVMQNSLYAIPDRDKLWPKLLGALTEDGAIVITNSDREGSGTIIREHLAHASWLRLLHPKLIMVGMIDAFISQLSGEGAFHFVSEKKLRQEIEQHGGHMGQAERVYGGVNVLFSVTRGARK